MNAPMIDDRTTNGVRTNVVVRWSDMDAYGHVNHSRTVTLLEEARVETVFKPGTLTGSLGAGAVVAALQVNYCRQLVHDDSPLQVLMWVSRLRAADFTCATRCARTARTSRANRRSPRVPRSSPSTSPRNAPVASPRWSARPWNSGGVTEARASGAI